MSVRSDLQTRFLLRVEACCGARGGMSASGMSASAASLAAWLQGSMTVDPMTKSQSRVCMRRPPSSFWLRYFNRHEQSLTLILPQMPQTQTRHEEAALAT